MKKEKTKKMSSIKDQKEKDTVRKYFNWSLEIEKVKMIEVCSLDLEWIPLHLFKCLMGGKIICIF